ncbi:MAG: NAD(P)-dependent dehydrogenase (short-subunit alcohol dehydrogenase family) [Acidimicrobiales bacterium]|jgi:NAD(P)-dependent dehydrogenase (short-subunit alcohol dehydrogenase family)
MIVLITGASSGIGLQAAVELARRGETVVASMRDTRRSTALLEAAKSAGVSVDVAELDVTDRTSVTAAIDGVIERHGRIDVVVNNAGVWTVGPLEHLSDDETSGMIDTNLAGTVRVIQATVGHMRSQGGGRIINVGSAVADPGHGVRLVALYSATKAALRSLSFELAKELRPVGIDVVHLEGGIRGQTGMWANAGAKLESFSADSPYREVEAIAARQMRAAIAGQSDPSGAAKIMADACTVESPAIRHPPEAQSGSWGLITDEEFIQLCDGADPAPINERHGIDFSFWGI